VGISIAPERFGLGDEREALSFGARLGLGKRCDIEYLNRYFPNTLKLGDRKQNPSDTQEECWQSDQTNALAGTFLQHRGQNNHFQLVSINMT